MKLAKFSIARACGLCLLSFGLAASVKADDVADISSRVLQILYLQQAISGDTSDISDHVSGIVSHLNALNQTTSDNYALLASLNSTVAALTGLVARASGGGGQDVLAGNPWWATNSAFALTKYQYSLAYPNESPNGTYSFSFPQWASKLTGMLSNNRIGTSEYVSKDVLRANWVNSFGLDAIRNGGSISQNVNPYTWFDWMVDATKSNWVLQASILSKLSGISNALASSVSGGGSFEDVLAGNPYWSTNSSFAVNWDMWGSGVPSPFAYQGLSFPEAFSVLLSSRAMDSSWHSRDDFWDYFGIDGVNSSRFGSTFDDWLAEAIKSNLVLQTSASISNIEEELASTDYEEQVAPTNTPLPGYIDLVREADTSSGSSSLSTGEDAINAQIDSLAGLLDSATPSSEIVVIPEFTVGGIHVQERRANLATSITPIAKRIMQFLWAVALFSSLFSLAQAEFAFYASVGRHWAVSHGALTERDI